MATEVGTSPKEKASSRRDESDIDRAISRRDWKGAITLLMQHHGDSIYRFCLTMTGDDALAAELRQTTFVQAFTDLEGFSGRSLPSTWLFAIARNRCLDALKARRRWRDRFRALDPEGGSEDVADTVPPIDERLGRQELVAALEYCVRKLAPSARAVVLLRYVEGLSYDEIARSIGERAGTLRVRSARAIKALRACVERRGRIA